MTPAPTDVPLRRSLRPKVPPSDNYQAQPKRIKAAHQPGHDLQLEEAAEGEVDQSEAKDVEAEHSSGHDSELQDEEGEEGAVELENTLTEYEKERLKNVLRNQQFLQNLGIYNTKSSLEARPSKRPWSKHIHPPERPLRRSLRAKVPSRRNSFSDVGSTGRNVVPIVDSASDEDCSLDGPLFKTYVCAAGRASCQDHCPSSVDWSNLMGYRTLREPLVDRSLDIVITMDILTSGDAEKGLLAAGDGKGRIALFETSLGSSPCSQSLDGISTRSRKLAVEERERPSLCSWKEWKENFYGMEIQFLSQQPSQETTFLLSSAPNGSLVLWGLNIDQSSNEAHNYLSHAQAGFNSLHSRDIAGMHELNGRIATVSLDSSLASCTITEARIAKERVIAGHHAGTIKCVQFRETNILADGGLDSRMCILDLRTPNPCVSTIKTLHKRAIQVVEWSPMQESLLLSSSNEPHILVYDIRSPASPLFTLEEHHKTVLRRKYRPAFVGDGSMVATPGNGSKMLTLYSLNTGTIVSQGFLGFDPTCVMGSRRTSGNKLNIWVSDSTKHSSVVPLTPMILNS